MRAEIAPTLTDLEAAHRLLRSNARSTTHLDVVTRERTSVYPWRGQFSPQFVERMLTGRVEAGQLVLDPFVGSGTSLVEAARLGVRATGVEANPAAFLLTASLRIAALEAGSRSAVIARGRDIMHASIGQWHGGLFDQSQSRVGMESLQARVRHALRSESPDLPCLLVAVAAMLGAGKSGPVTASAIASGWEKLELSISRLPSRAPSIQACYGDARHLPHRSDSADLAFTSPPYINVFNYHQNYRKAVEWLGLKPLSVAPTEIGANRKHRQNRFLTVVQYPMDMALALSEMARVVKPDGQVILVVGRESNVRGVPFPNGLMLSMVAESACGLRLSDWGTRSFTSRYGGRIWEDLLVLDVPHRLETPDLRIAREVGKRALESADGLEADEAVRDDRLAALEAADGISPSPSLPRYTDIVS